METETILFYGLIGILLVVFTTLILLLVHAGLFLDIVVDTCKPQFGDLQIAYKSATGPYKESGALFTEAHSLLPHHKTVGVFYDDPKKKEPSRLRYIVGLILTENGEDVDPDERKLLEQRDFKFATFPSINHAVQTSFPFNSTLSIILAVYKVYPALDEYIKWKRLCAHPFMEIYDNDLKKIVFVCPLEKQDDFYVPEVKLEDSKGDDEDDHSSVSWDDSASFIRNDPQDFDTDSIGDDSSVSVSHASMDSGQHGSHLLAGKNTPDLIEPLPSKQSAKDAKDGLVSKAKSEDDSDNTSSSFEEIDETDVQAVNLTVSSTVIPADATVDPVAGLPAVVESLDQVVPLLTLPDSASKGDL